MRLIHLTDPHLTSPDNWRPGFGFGKWGKRGLSWLSWETRRRARHRRSRLSALVKHLRADDPDAWAITGDLCQIGLEDEARQAAAWLADLAPAQHALLVPGNHDIFARDSRTSIVDHWGEYLHVDATAPEWPAVRRIGDVTLIGLNSAIVTPVFRATGRLGSAMRDRLAGVLAEHRGRCRVILIHHPPLPASCKPRKALTDARELGQLLRDQGAGLVLHGHLHRNQESRLETAWGNKVAIFCTASASATDPRNPAAARVFDFKRESGGYSIRMRLKALDASNRLHVIETSEWNSAG